MCSKNDARTQMKTLGNKLVSLGRSYGSSEKYFPTGRHPRSIIPVFILGLYKYRYTTLACTTNF